MTIRAIEYADRWVYRMRDYSIEGVVFDNLFTLELSPPGKIILGGDALLSNGPLNGPGIHVAKLKEYDRSALEGLIGARLLSTVGFKTGWLRIGLTGWQINVPDGEPFISAEIEAEGSTLWYRSGVNTGSNNATVEIGQESVDRE